MKRRRYADEQVALALRQAEGGTPVAEVCREMGASEATFFRWKKRSAGMGAAEIRRLKRLEDETAKLKRLVADLALDKAMPQDVPRRSGEARRAPGRGAPPAGRLRGRRAAGGGRRAAGVPRDRVPQTGLRIRLRDLAAARARHGYRRPRVLPRREGRPVNHKRTHRLCAEEGLPIRPKVPRRKRAWRYRVGRPGAPAPSEVWSVDFVADRLFDGRPIRILAALDARTREALSIAPRASFRAFDVVAELGRLAEERGRPRTLKVDDGPGFAGRLPDRWAHLNGVEIDSSRPGRPADNARIETFDARLRAECLNASWFLSPADARDRPEAWRREHNEERPHGALRNSTPRAFAEQAQHARKAA